MPSEKPLPAVVITWLERVDERWRQGGVDVATRSRLAADLADDLGAALAAGADVAELTAEDPVAFADRVAVAAGTPSPVPHRPTEASPRNVVLTGLAGAAVGGLFVWIFLIPYLARLFVFGPAAPASEVVAALVIYLICGVTVVACCLAAIASRFRDDPMTGRVVRHVGVAIVLFGAASILPAVGLATLLGYSSSAASVTLIGLLVLGFVAAGIFIGQRRARPAVRRRLLVAEPVTRTGRPARLERPAPSRRRASPSCRRP